jgi:hypothetical protein
MKTGSSILVPTAALFLSGCASDAPVTAPTPNDPPAPGPGWSFGTQVLAPLPGAWDSMWVAGAAMIVRDGLFHLWYGGSGHPSLRDPISIGYATSADGIDWVRASAAPVLAPRPDMFDHTHVQRPFVLLDGDTLRMWYGGGAHPTDHDIGYATSTDGLQWNRRPEPVLVRGGASAWHAEFVSPGTVIREDGLFRMWFYGGRGHLPSGHWGNGPIEIGHATSPDGITWTRSSANPVVIPPPPWTVAGTAPTLLIFATVRRVGDRDVMWFTGWHSNHAAVGIAEYDP